MILVCPSCDAKFNIPAGAISGEGRKVRCARCQHSWHATSTDLRDPAPTPPPAAVQAAPIQQPAVQPQPQMPQQRVAETPVNFDGELDANTAAQTAALRQSVREEVVAPPSVEPEPEDDPFADNVAPASDFDDDLAEAAEESDDFGASLREKYGSEFLDDEDDDDDFITRRRAEQRKQNERDLVARERRLMRVGWFSLVLFIAASIYLVFFDRTLMRAYLPNAAAFFDQAGESVSEVEVMRQAAEAEGGTLTPSNAEAIEVVNAVLYNSSTGVEIRNGEQALILRGYVENLGTTGAKVPQVLAQIFNANGQVIDSWVFDPPGLLIRRGGKLDFEQVRVPIPVGIANVQVSVIKDSRSSTEGAYPQ
ncbi:zinc-ribbon domain-containing protein [Kordiimonas sp. SCSIO 12603]|uniref:zinc-ribbon domain-containing protein n=1 Tax=Kordiimonas sp. SCSIO 12603 TaxID=2829596 RepID=UPI002106B54E|nr:zinc-ribbon domain-containing protein [Kordiimonas sp. SCSIO 12603]UTW58489.1 zinc-ribbon domain-containing protein [Kordiimonas sp. SCSIO 12603]